MSIIQFQEANCKNCYKCIRNCSVKSITFRNEQAQIEERDCILCGRCLLACPQGAKSMDTDMGKVSSYLRNGERVYVSLAPSYASSFGGAAFSQVSAALKKLGFAGVEETAIGAEQITENFGDMLETGELTNMITTCCPTVVLMVERHYPELLPYLAPVVSPMLAHGRLLKEVYGKRARTVFIGPCISKLHEARSGSDEGAINAVLTFDEVTEWLDSEGITLDEKDPEAREMVATINRLYPVPGGIIQTIPKEKRSAYRCMTVDGTDRCIETFDALKNNELEGYMIEMSACAGSCVNGPGLQNHKVPFMVARSNVLDRAVSREDTQVPLTEDVSLNLRTEYVDRSRPHRQPTDQQIENVFLRMGKNSPEKILNCGACGYDSCRDKAIAVLQGKADIHMCIPYMREKAESVSNVVMENAPDAIILMDDNYCLTEYNQRAADMFGLDKVNYVGKPVSMLIDCDDMDVARDTGQDVYDRKIQYNDFGLTVLQSTVYVKDHGIFILLIRDITEAETERSKLEELREETVGVAQNVIDKQMRVAQEIASLLGETTAETKMALTNLKKYLHQETEDGRIY